MSFLFPLFLIAGITLIVPILLHLFNLRKYKKVYFPHTRFLQQIAIQSKRQSKLQDKWLLLSRLLLLTFVVLAFAQPYFNNQNKNLANAQIQAIIIDNSASMSLSNGAQDVLEQAKQAAYQFLQQQPTTNQFYIATNNGVIEHQSLKKDEAIQAIKSIQTSGTHKTINDVLDQIQLLASVETDSEIPIYYFSDFQKNKNYKVESPKNTVLNYIPMTIKSSGNAFVDTAYLIPDLNPGSYQVMVKTRSYYKDPFTTTLRLSTNQQVRSAKEITIDQNGRWDTLQLATESTSWSPVIISIQDEQLPLDDTFRIGLKSNVRLEILHLYQHQPSPQLLAALHADPNFAVHTQGLTQDVEPKDYALIVIDGVTSWEGVNRESIKNITAQSTPLVIFPGRVSDANDLNSGLEDLLKVSIVKIDTAQQQATILQSGHEVVQGVFEQHTDRLQLPSVKWYYSVKAHNSSNQQVILGFRSGQPLLASYQNGQTKGYLMTSGLDEQSSNFANSYFFVPFLHRMTVLGNGSNQLAYKLGSQDPLYVGVNTKSDKDVLHFIGDGYDVIPPQRLQGKSVSVFLNQLQPQVGFYELKNTAGESMLVGVNADNTESELDFYSKKDLEKSIGEKNIKIISFDNFEKNGVASVGSSFPLWKVCVILALISFALECWLLYRKYLARTNKSKTQIVS